MFLFRNILRNITRYRMKSLVSIAICAVVVLLLNVYVGNLESNRQQLSQLPKVVPVSARISNLNGSQSVGLNIKEELVREIQESPYVKNAAFSIQLAGSPTNFEKGYDPVYIAAANSVRSVFGLSWDNIKLDPRIPLNFLMGEENYGLIDENLAQKKRLEVGDTCRLHVYYYDRGRYGDVNLKYLSAEDFRIVGTMTLNDRSVVTDPVEMIIPFGWAVKKHQEIETPYVADSASFALKNPEQLNEFKDQMSQLNLMEVITAADMAYDGNALVVKDDTFIQSATRIRDNIKLLKNFFPIVTVLVIFLGYIVSYLLIQNRRSDYALMRAVGTGRIRCFVSFFMEHLLLAAAGAGIGCAAAMAASGAQPSVILECFALFILCYMLGTTAALILMGKVTVMKILSQRD